MKVVTNILRIIVAIILTVSIIGIVAIKIASSTIMDEVYVINLLRSSNYYDNIYEEIKSNFENYIHQSGLEEEVLEGICTKEDVEKDTELIIVNIYEGKNEVVTAEGIRQKLVENINTSLEGTRITSNMQKAIDQFVDTICDEYITTISHTNYEDTIHDTYKEVESLLQSVQKILYASVITCIIALIILSIKQIDRAISYVGIAITSSGAFLVVSNFIINSNVNVQHIKVLNDSISIVLQNGIVNILEQITKTGIVLTIIGIILIVLGAMGKAAKTED